MTSFAQVAANFLYLEEIPSGIGSPFYGKGQRRLQEEEGDGREEEKRQHHLAGERFRSQKSTRSSNRQTATTVVTPADCYQACQVRLAPLQNFFFNLYRRTEDSDQEVCTCVDTYSGQVVYPGAQTFSTCSTSSAIVIRSRFDKKAVLPGRLMRYKVTLKDRGNKKGEGGLLALEVVLPSGVTYVKSSVSPRRISRERQESRGEMRVGGHRKSFLPEVNGPVITWKPFSFPQQGRRRIVFEILLHVAADEGILVFGPTTIYQVLPGPAVGASMHCPNIAPNATLTLKGHKFA